LSFHLEFQKSFLYPILLGYHSVDPNSYSIQAVLPFWDFLQS